MSAGYGNVQSYITSTFNVIGQHSTVNGSQSSVGHKLNAIFALSGHGSQSSVGRKLNAIFALSGHGSQPSVGRKSNAIFALSGHGSQSSVSRKSNAIFALPGHGSPSSVGRKSNAIFALSGHGSPSSVGRKSNAIFALPGHRSTSSAGRKSNGIFALPSHGSTSFVGLCYTRSALIIINPSHYPLVRNERECDEGWFLVSEGGGEKRKKSNNDVPLESVLVSGILPLVDGTVNIHIHEGDSESSCYAHKLSPTSIKEANLQKLDADVPNDAGYDIWLPLASVREVSDRMKNSLNGYFIGKRLVFSIVEWFVRNNWEKYGLKKVTLVKGFFFFQFSSNEGVDSVHRDGPWMIRGVSIFLNKWSLFVSLLKEELSCVLLWVKFHDVPIGKSGYARILIEIDTCNDLCDNMVMAVPNIEGPGYTKETIRVEYEWKPPCCGTCLVFGHSVDDCPKAPKQVVNRVEKGKGGSYGTDDEGFTEVKKKKSGGFSVGKKNVSASGNSFKTASKTNASTPGNRAISLSNSFDALNDDNLVIVEVESVSKASTSGMHMEGDDEVEFVDNDMARDADYNYDPYDNDMYECQKIPDNLQAICYKMNIKESYIGYQKKLDIKGLIPSSRDET
nr:hypothetical protein [Tanacetum cinerariifolium]